MTSPPSFLFLPFNSTFHSANVLNDVLDTKHKKVFTVLPKFSLYVKGIKEIKYGIRIRILNILNMF